MFSRTSRVRHIAKAINHQWILALQLLSRNGSVGSERHRRKSINAILRPSSAPSAEISHHDSKVRPVGFLSRKVQHISTLTRNRHPLRQRLRQCTIHHIEHPKE